MADDAIEIEVKGLEQIQRKLEQMARDLRGGPIVAAMREATLLVQRGAKTYAPVDTGRLRASIIPEVVQHVEVVQGIVGSNVSYACLFDAHTLVVTRTGSRTIGQIEIGEFVLAQDGHYHRVIAKNIFPATEKPDLIDIEVPWRKGKNHKLTLTVDHKVLTYKDSRNQWILAGKLAVGDCLYTRRKISHNKGIRTAPVKICKNCQREYWKGWSGGKGQGKKFCSYSCKMKYWNAGHNPHTGMKRSAQTCENIRLARKALLERRPDLRLNQLLAKRGYITSCEKQLKNWLDSLSIEYEHQKRIGKHIVDFFVPQDNVIFEADGAYWHQNQEKDIARDRELYANTEGAKILHVHFYEERFSPELNPNPLPDVYYVAVNPGMKSYINPDLFKSSEIVSIRRWTYIRPPGRQGAKVAKLYDITVEGMHSFFANGILVSNSYQEIGTKYMPGKRYLRRAYERYKGYIKGIIEKAIAQIVNK